jgi:hypothetical protein
MKAEEPIQRLRVLPHPKGAILRPPQEAVIQRHPVHPHPDLRAAVTQRLRAHHPLLHREAADLPPEADAGNQMDLLT